MSEISGDNWVLRFRCLDLFYCEYGTFCESFAHGICETQKALPCTKSRGWRLILAGVSRAPLGRIEQEGLHSQWTLVKLKLTDERVGKRVNYALGVAITLANLLYERCSAYKAVCE